MKDKLFMIVFVLVLGSVLTTALLAVDSFTSPRVQANKVRTVRASILRALGIPFQEGTMEARFADSIRVKNIDGHTVYFSKDGSVAFEIKGSGVWGPVEGVLSLNSDLKTIKRLIIIHQEETPGLGGRIAEHDFLDRFKGVSIAPRLEMVAAGKGGRANQVEAITGATLSSNALAVILKSEIETYTPLISEVEAQ